ncbi:MAG TPA: hypothetical protein VGH91_12065 [Gammaproteobacteria bacterium]|jgi:hypothetical protein
MSIRKWFLVSFTVLVVAVCLAIPLIPETAQPFDMTLGSSATPSLVVLPSSLGVPMPPGLHAGDKVYLSDMSPATRSFFMVGGSNPPRGTSIDLPVRDPDGSVHHVQSQFVPIGFLSGNALNMATQLASYALYLLFAALGLLLLWRGQSRAAYGVALWCFANLLQAVFAVIPLPAPYGNMLNWLGSTLSTLGTLVSLYIVADGLTMGARTPQRRRGSHWRFAFVLVLYAIGVATFNLRFYLHGDFKVFDAISWGLNVIVGLHFAAFLIPLSVLAFSYRRCDPVNQARIRWILFSLVGLLLTYGLALVAGRLGVAISVLNLMATILTAATFVGFAYAVLRHRLVSLQFVLNRALVYGLITSLVVGVFAAMLSFLEHETLNTETNRTLALIVPLLLGLGLNTLKRNVDAYINKIFFRNRHRAEESLAQFARTCAYVEDPDKLLDLTADEVFRHGTPQALAIYITEPGKAGAKLVRERGDAAYAKHLNIDDLGFLRLRAGDLEVDLHGVASGLGTEGNVYAFTVRGQVLGFIVLGARPGEAYSPEERRLFALVAHQVAVALHSLRLEEEHRLLRELAEGAFNSLPMAQAKAKELIRAAN